MDEGTSGQGQLWCSRAAATTVLVSYSLPHGAAANSTPTILHGLQIETDALPCAVLELLPPAERSSSAAARSGGPQQPHQPLPAKQRIIPPDLAAAVPCLTGKRCSTRSKPATGGNLSARTLMACHLLHLGCPA